MASVSGGGCSAALAILCVALMLLLLPSTALGHGLIPQTRTHDNPSLFQLLITPVVIALLHLGAMLALVYLAASARKAAANQSAGVTERKGSTKKGRTPTAEGLDPLAVELIPAEYRKGLQIALRPNRNMYIASDSLPYFFVLTGLAAFLSIFTYAYLGEQSVYIYTAIHSAAIVLLFYVALRGWRVSAFGASSTRVLVREGVVADRSLVVDMDRVGIVVVRQNALQRMATVGSLHFYADATFKEEFADACWNDVDDPFGLATRARAVLGLGAEPATTGADDSEE